MLIDGMRVSSWWIARIPARCASRGPAKLSGSPVDPGQDLDERGLAGAVLAGERVHLAAGEEERDVVEGEDARERLHDRGGFEGLSCHEILPRSTGYADRDPHRHTVGKRPDNDMPGSLSFDQVLAGSRRAM
jgi:hypothetical protein